MQEALASCQKDAAENMRAATAQLEDVTARLSTTQADAEAVRQELTAADRKITVLEARLRVAGDDAAAATHREQQEQTARLLHRKQDQMRGLECALHEAQQARGALEHTVGSLIAINDDLHAHVHKVCTRVLSGCRVTACRNRLQMRVSVCRPRAHFSCHDAQRRTGCCLNKPCQRTLRPTA